ncbi:MAG: NADH-quinone oxidoreductase subunit C [Actinomycetota bacterium]|nr:NADH-quinone oxidoreductase subunit C [Actinomycetota bacterium]
MTPEQLEQLLVESFRDHVRGAEVAFGQFTATLDAEGYVEAARFCRDDPRLACDFFDCLFGVDERDEGFAVIANLYSTTHRHRVLLRHLCPGGREQPVAPSLTSLYRGADWHEREAWDMFGIEFDGHPGLSPRLLCPENFEGWPLRKDFPLATREAKPWPGAKEPVEQGTEEQREDALVSTVTSAGIKGDEEPGAREEVAAKAERARQKAAELRRKRASGGAGVSPASEGGAGVSPAIEGATGVSPANEERPTAPEGSEGGKPERPASPQESVASDPRVASRAQRSAEASGVQDLGGARHRAETGGSQGPTGETPISPRERRPGEESQEERAQRAAGESQEAHAARDLGVYDQTSVPGEHTAGAGDAGELGGAYYGGPPAPPSAPSGPDLQGTTPLSGDAGKAWPIEGGEPAPPGNVTGRPPTTQSPGEAPVEGGIREHIEEEADEQTLRHGERPPSTASPGVQPPPLVDEDAPTVLDLAARSGEPEALGPSGPQETEATSHPGDEER